MLYQQGVPTKVFLALCLSPESKRQAETPKSPSLIPPRESTRIFPAYHQNKGKQYNYLNLLKQLNREKIYYLYVSMWRSEKKQKAIQMHETKAGLNCVFTFTSRCICPWWWRYSKPLRTSRSTVAMTASSKPVGWTDFIMWRKDPPAMYGIITHNVWSFVNEQWALTTLGWSMRIIVWASRMMLFCIEYCW